MNWLQSRPVGWLRHEGGGGVGVAPAREGQMSQPDVVVVGGGLIGMLTAAELSERGVSVCVIEKDDVGFEQSGRSVAAINLPGGTPNPESSLLRVSAEQWSAFEDRWGHGIDLNAG